MSTHLLDNSTSVTSYSRHYIKVRNNVIPINNTRTNPNNNNELENTEKVLRYYGKGMKEEQLTLFANFLYHEFCVNKPFEDLINYIDDKLLKLRYLKCITVKDTAELNQQRLNEENAEMILVKIESKSEGQLPVFLFLQKNNLMHWPTNNAVQQIYDNNIKILERLKHTESEIYIRESRNFERGFTKITEDLNEIIALILIAFPRYITSYIKEIVKKDLWKETELSRVYHENSKLHSFHQQGDFMKPLDEIDEKVKKVTAKGRKNFINKEKIPLPAPTKENKKTLEEVVLARRSLRNYSNTPVDIQTLSNILYYSYGVTGELKNTALKLRAVPSGGGLYPIDIYISINNVESLEIGIYYYDPLDHALICVNKNDLKNTSKELSGYSMILDKAAFTIILGANFWRNQWKYHERGYRIILLDCGHIAQNLHMMATSYGLGSNCLMGFVDDELNKLLDLDGVVEHSMYLITVGKIE